MSSTGGLPPSGVRLPFQVTRVDPARQGSVFVRLWGRFHRERQLEYQRLHDEIQNWVKGVGDTGGAAAGRDPPTPPLETNERCLAEMNGEWHRARVVTRSGDDYTVFTLDEGRATAVRGRGLERGKKDFFQLPPEAVCCILANLVPPGAVEKEKPKPKPPEGEEEEVEPGVVDGQPEEEDEGGDGAKPTCWPPGALCFLRSLQGRELDGYVEAVLPNRLVLLDVPRVSRQLCESGLAKVIGRTAFRLLVEMSTSRPATAGRRESRLLLAAAPAVVSGGAEIGAGAAGNGPGLQLALPPPPPPPPPPAAPPSDATYSLNYFYPLLQVDDTVTVTVRVTHVRYPDRFFCQLRCHCPELERLHLSMHRYYESSRVSGITSASRKLGSPCAAKSLDGQWYRAVVQQTLADHGVEVFLVDYGNKEVVSSCSIRKLSPGYFKMPVVTYPFALREASDYGRGWSAKQIELLQSLIVNKVLQAKIEFYNSVENVYYVTLYREDGSTINTAFNAQVENLNYEPMIGYCEDNELRGDYQKINALHCSGDYFTRDRRTEGLSKTKDRISYLSMLLGASLLKNANLKLNAFYDALVEFVKDPTEFWIRTMDTASEFEKLMNSIAKKYGPLGRNEGLVKKPEPGLLCCAKFKADHLYYRAVITEILDGQFRVFFIDYGNLELVDWHDVKALLPEYRKLPALAVKCCLADLVPKEVMWSKEAIAYFEKVVFEKHLVVHVLDKEMDKYLIELLDVEDEGEPSVNKIMLQEGYADQKALKVSHFSSKSLYSLDNVHISNPSSEEIAHTYGRSKKTRFEQRPITPEKLAPCMEYLGLTEDSNDCLATVLSNVPYKISSAGEIETGDSRTQNIAVMDSAITESPYKQEYLKVGSTVDVQVSYIDEPGDFWCQLTKNTHELKMLMSKMQEYYNTHEDRYQHCQSACVAKYSEDGKWYRALILGKVSPLEVDVLYVDYGNRERVSFSDLCALRPEFLILKGQAFRCSLYNIIQPMGSDPFMWNVDSVAAFQEFIDSALSLYMELKCTVYALTIVDGKGLCNVVDLNTPFQSACQLLIERGLAKFVGSPSVLAPSVNLYTYYYSTHDVKIGSEEEMYVSHVTSPTKFYCLLSRNLDIVDKLADKVNKLACKLADYKFSQGVDPICLAKYTDNQWYRALAWPIQDRIRVSFVDYGNKLDVDKDDLLPIPDSARDVKFLPMQAIKCGLSDIPAELSLDINTWFRKAVTDKPLKAVVVAKESDGKLIVELYDGNMQINARIKEQLYLQGTSEAKTMNGNSGRQKIKSEKLCSTFLVKSDHETSSLKRRIVEDQDEVLEAERAAVSSHMQDRWKNRTDIIVQNVEAELKCAPNMDLKNVKESSDVKSNVEIRDNKSEKNDVEKTSFGKLRFDASKLPLPKEIDIPLITLKPGFKCEARISHVVSSSHFFVHLSQHDDKVSMMEEKLNTSWANDTEIECFQYENLQLGDVVCAESPEGGSYRSVVTQKIANNLVGVEFIDYGNSVNIQPSKIHRLSKEAIEVQRLSIPCFISGQDTLSTGYSVEFISAFKKRMKGIMCEFIKLHGQLWEVQLYDHQGRIANLLESALCEQYALNSQQESECFISDIRPGSKLNAYIFAIKSPNQFWCQFVTTADGIFIESLQKTKGEHCKMRSEDIMDPKVGNVCMVKSKVLLDWATCEIVDVCNGAVEVVFMKEDNKEMVNPKDVKEVTPAFALTYECKLYRLFPFNGSNWSQKAIEFFKTLVLYKRVLIKVINMSKPNILEVDIYVNLDNAVRDQLTALELAIEKDESNTTMHGRYIRKIPLVGQTIEGYVTVAESPSYFWCQYSTSEIQMLAGKMQELGKREGTGTKLSFSVGDSCFCKFSEDEQFYRTEVKKTNSNILSLNYVDYGNEEEVVREQVRKLPEELLKIPVQAFPCCLSGYDLSEGSWKDSAVGDFFHLVSDQLLKITVLKNECGKDDVPFVLHVQIESSSGIINNQVKSLWKPHSDKDNRNVCDEKKLPTDQSLSLQSFHNDINLEGKLMEDVIPNAPCPKRLKAEELVQFRMDDGEEMDGNSPAAYLVEEKFEAQENSESEVDLQFQKLEGDETDNERLITNEVQIPKLSESHSPSLPGSFLIHDPADNLETTVIDQFEGPASSSCPNDWIPTLQAYMDQCLSSSQAEDEAPENVSSLQPVDHKMGDNLEDSIQTIDLYEEIFKGPNDQPVMEDTGDDSMTRLLISQDDSEDQNLPETQRDISEREHFETEQLVVTEKDDAEDCIPVEFSLITAVNTSMEKGTLLVHNKFDLGSTCVEVDEENKQHTTSYTNAAFDDSSKKMISYEVQGVQEGSLVPYSDVAKTAAGDETHVQQFRSDVSEVICDQLFISTNSENIAEKNRLKTLYTFSTPDKVSESGSVSANNANIVLAVEDSIAVDPLQD